MSIYTYTLTTQEYSYDPDLYWFTRECPMPAIYLDKDEYIAQMSSAVYVLLPHRIMRYVLYCILLLI